jgi:hypothetical protein
MAEERRNSDDDGASVGGDGGGIIGGGNGGLLVVEYFPHSLSLLSRRYTLTRKPNFTHPSTSTFTPNLARALSLVSQIESQFSTSHVHSAVFQIQVDTQS